MWNTGLGNLALNTRKVNNADYNEIVNWGFRYARNATGDMVTVQGGTLPESSELAGQKVQAFQIGRTEVTWGEWKTVRTWAAANGYSDLATIGNGTADNHPVRNVSWYDVVKWSNAKSQMEGLSPVYTTNGTTYKTGENDPSLNAAAIGYRLPVESEWEWAARGGVASQGYTYSGSNDWTEVAWTQENSSIGTKVVGVKVCNELGIYDASGNLWEWCEDVITTNNHPLRGGAWNRFDPEQFAVSFRGYRNGAGNRAAEGTLRVTRNAD
jgi:formylglycine-generating enzyme required for sulfatase activity